MYFSRVLKQILVFFQKGTLCWPQFYSVSENLVFFGNHSPTLFLGGKCFQVLFFGGGISMCLFRGLLYFCFLGLFLYLVVLCCQKITIFFLFCLLLKSLRTTMGVLALANTGTLKTVAFGPRVRIKNYLPP